MRRAHALLLLLAVLVALALWWLVGGGGADAPGQPAEPAAAAADAPAESRSETAAPDSAAGLARTEAPAGASEPAAAPDRTLTVRVTIAETGKPAAGAEVLFLPANSAWIPAAEAREYARSRLEMQLERWGRVVPCDAQGVARVPMPDGNWFPVAARSQGLWGREDVTAGQTVRNPEILIELKPDLQVRVLVLDEARKPVAGVPVAYRVTRSGKGHNLVTELTGPDGIAALLHLQYEWHRNDGSDKEHVVALALPFEPTVQAVFNPARPPMEPILLVMPATGTVEIEVLDPAGQPYSGKAQIALQKRVADEPRTDPTLLNNQAWKGLQWAPALQGVARFERIGLGLELEYGADFYVSGRIERQLGAGPTRAGETVRFTLRQPKPGPALRGRMVDGESKPLAGWTNSAELYPAGSDRRCAVVVVRTDADGRFEAPLPGSGLPNGDVLLLMETQAIGSNLIASVQFQLPLPDEGLELGDVMFGGPVFVAGIVVDGQDQPLPDAQGNIIRLTSPAGAARAEGPRYNELGWFAGEDGRFEIRGTMPEGRYQIDSQLSGVRNWTCEPVEFRNGASDLRLRLGRKPGVYGRVVADPGIPLDSLTVGLEAGSRLSSVGLSAEDGAFALRTSHSGLVELAVYGAGRSEAIWRRPGIALDGTRAVDVEDLDLRGQILATRVAVTDPDGNPLSTCRMWTSKPPAPWQLESLRLPATLLSGIDGESYWLSAPGCALTELRLDGLEKTVRMAPPLRARVSVAGLLPEWSGTEIQITARTVLQPGQPRFPNTVNAVIAHDASEVILELDQAGEWTLELRYLREADTLSLVMDGLGKEQPRITLQPQEGIQDFQVTVNAEAVAKALAGG